MDQADKLATFFRGDPDRRPHIGFLTSPGAPRRPSLGRRFLAATLKLADKVRGPLWTAIEGGDLKVQLFAGIGTVMAEGSISSLVGGDWLAAARQGVASVAAWAAAHAFARRRQSLKER